MIKTFTLHSIDHEFESQERGFIAWYLTDENNSQRKVTGVTELSRQGFIKTIRPNNDREMPLVELLSYYVEGESFRIDFSRFNEIFGYTPRNAYADSELIAANDGVKENLRQLFDMSSPTE